MSNDQFSALDNVKMTAKHISTIFSFKITLRKDIFTKTYIDPEFETSISIWEFEMMIVLK